MTTLTEARGWTRPVSRGLSIVAVLAAATVFVTCTILDSGGLPVLAALEALGAIALTQLFPGVLLWRCVRPREGWLVEDLACGLALGTGLTVPAQILGGTLDARWPAYAVPLGVAAVLLALPLTRGRIRTARWAPVPWWFGVVLGAASLLALPQLINFVTSHPVRWTVPTSASPDQQFHLALAGELLHRGPSGWPMVQGETLGYHWFGHAWLAQVSAATGLPLDEVLLRVAAFLMPLVIVAATAALALRLTSTAWAGAVAAVLVMAGAAFNPWGERIVSIPVNPESFTLGLSAPLLLCLVNLLTLRWRGLAERGSVVLVPLLTMVCAATKGSTVPVIIAGTGMAAVAMLLWRRDRLRLVALDLLLLVVALAVTLKVVFNGSAGGLTFDPVAAVNHTFFSGQVQGVDDVGAQVIAGVVTVVGGLTRALLGLCVVLRRRTVNGRLDPVAWLLLGAALGGSLVPALFIQPGMSQYYFTISAFPLAAVASAVGAVVLAERFGSAALRGWAVFGVLGGLAVWWLPTAVLGPVHIDDLASANRVLIGGVVTALVLGAAAAVFSRRRRPAAVLATATIAVIASGAVGSLMSLRTPVRQPPGPASVLARGVVTQGQIDAATYIRRHSGRHDVVMTNRHCTVPVPAPGEPCESRRFLVAGYSERQVLLEGWAYSPTIGRIAPEARTSLTHAFWNPSLQRLNDTFYTAPTAAARNLLWRKGVRWLYMDSAIRHKQRLAPFAQLRFTARDGTATAWKMIPPPRSS
ncbi:hypothetical protein [Luteipulveratus halotolerans]|uniref:Uncharacterized protein n=1 Tax=Luteipulveratus halotolerans TaxID=1631356 RepID=A0A0L6CFZ9_9MICO|nr:hypothetical protein [Luteipulveratus halotolerans]KNX36756.1 hypothetical protein VV01_05715 [Luteipulveratus halotolerans]